MVDRSSRRHVIVLVPAHDGARVLAEGDDLPTLDCALEPGESTIQAVARVLAAMDLRGPILDCVVDQRDAEQLGDQPRSALVELGSPPRDWSAPSHWSWLPWNELGHAPATGLDTVTTLRLAEHRGESPVPAQRAAWTRPGWYEQVTVWIHASLAAAGRDAPHALVQVRHWGISALIRVDASDGRTWFKASFPLFFNEASIAAELATIAPGMTGTVVAADASKGWLLTEDFAGTTDATDSETTRKAVDHLVRLQTRTRDHQASLRAAGCVDRPLGDLTADLEAALGSPVATSHLDLSVGLVQDLLAATTRATAVVEAVGLPPVLLHGDFHPGNIATTNDGMVLFDWSDGAFGNPVVDYATWAWWHEDAPDHERLVNDVWAVFCAAWQREFGVDASGLNRHDVDVVAGAYHLVSYVHIVAALEPIDRPSHQGGLDYFFELLSASAGRQG